MGSLQLIGIGFSSSMKMNFFAVLVFVGIVACVVCEEAKKEDVQEAAKDLKSDMKTKLKNLAMKSKRAKDYKRQDYYTGRPSRGSWAPYETTPYPHHYDTTGRPWHHPTTASREEYEQREEQSEKMEDVEEGEYTYPPTTRRY